MKRYFIAGFKVQKDGNEINTLVAFGLIGWPSPEDIESEALEKIGTIEGFYIKYLIEVSENDIFKLNAE